MTTAAIDQAPRPSAATSPRALAGSPRGFRTILAIHRGELYVPSSQLPDAGWMVRATAGDPTSPAGGLPSAA